MIPTHLLFSVGLKPEVCFCLFRTPADHNKNFYPILRVSSQWGSTTGCFKANGSSLNSAKMAVTAWPFCHRLLFPNWYSQILYLFLITCQLLPFFTSINILVNYRNQGAHNPFNYPSIDLSADKQS